MQQELRMRFTDSDTVRTSFLLENSCHIRDLELRSTDCHTLSKSHCTRLSTLTLDIVNGYSAKELIQRNQGLRTLVVNNSSTKRSVLLDTPTLQTIAGHSFLKTIRITTTLSRFMLASILQMLPKQLQELDMSIDIAMNQTAWSRIEDPIAPVLGLRSLLLNDNMFLKANSVVKNLLMRCPELEEITLPSLPDHFNSAELVCALDSYCPSLRTLNQERGTTCIISSHHMNAILRGFSRGFRYLLLGGTDCFSVKDHHPVLQTLLTTPTAHTIEVLRVGMKSQNHQNCRDAIGILKHCPRLRVFQVAEDSISNFELDISDLVQSTDNPWQCRETLEVLSMRIEHSTAQDVRRLFHWLRPFPRLTKLDLNWSPISVWKAFIVDFHLEELNEGAESDLVQMTKDDMEWMGL
ncbi:hypothetical protein BGX31_002141 [Mortierella sp. GBA43]|nr:hypothetical protein BGX31_002141 [Mortierella sp. GBA43]